MWYNLKIPSMKDLQAITLHPSHITNLIKITETVHDCVIQINTNETHRNWTLPYLGSQVRPPKKKIAEIWDI